MSNERFSCMEDCIHLKACRRMQKIIKSRYTGLQIARHCTEECSAYETFAKGIDYWGCEDEYKYTAKEVQYCIDRVYSDARAGYSDNSIRDYIDER